MRTRQFIAVVAVLSAGSVFAGDADIPGYGDSSGFMSTKTRAEVRADLEQARAQGLLNQNDAAYPISVESEVGARGPAGARASVRTGKTRAEVRKELETKGSLINKEYFQGGN